MSSEQLNTMESNDWFLGSYEIVVFFLTPLVLVGNCVVTTSAFVVIRRGGELCTVYMCLFSLALADCFNSLAVITALFHRITVGQQYSCAIHIGAIVCCSLVSIFSILLLAVERFCAVQGCKCILLHTPLKTGTVIILIWVLSLSYGLTPGLLEAEKANSSSVDSCEFTNSPISTTMSLALVAIPAMAFTACVYFCLFVRFKRKASKNTGSMKRKKSQMKSIALVSILSNCYVITWGPYAVGSLVYQYSCDQNDFECEELAFVVSSPLAGLAFINFLLNSLTYVWWYKPYHDGIKKIFCKSKSTARRRDTLADIPDKPSSTDIFFVGA